MRITPGRTTAATTRALTTTEGAVLALLALEGERSGYDLLKRVSRAIAYVWSPAKTQLYAVLPRLERDGLATSKEVAQANRPDKRLYRITPVGRSALDGWLAEIVPGDAQLFFLKAFVGGLMPRKRLIQHYEHFAREQEERIAELRSIEPRNTRRGHDYHHYLLLRLGIGRAEQSLAWANECLRDLRRKR